MSSQIKTPTNIQLSKIDPKSRVNVRLSEVDKNLDVLKDSIREHGFLSEFPIVIRPHPDPDSGFDYEHVSGQRRYLAASALGLAEIPALVEAISDEEAIQKSWKENETRQNLSAQDKSHWAEKITKRYASNGHTIDEALGLAAKYLGVSVDTARSYYKLSVLPADIMEMIDRGSLTKPLAVCIAENTFTIGRLKQSQENMRARAEWVTGLDRDHRMYVVKALKEKGHGASIEQLDEFVKRQVAAEGITVIIPSELRPGLLKWGEKNGVEGDAQIITAMVMSAIGGE